MWGCWAIGWSGGGSGSHRPYTGADVAVLRLLGLLAPVLRPESGRSGAGPELFRFVAQEVREMDLSHGWLVLAPGVVRWLGSADEVPDAVRGLGACTVVCLGEKEAA